MPKNLLYLTDRLPKPNYDSAERRAHNRSEETDNRKGRGPSQNLPEIKKSKHRNKKQYDTVDQGEGVSQSQALPTIEKHTKRKIDSKKQERHRTRDEAQAQKAKANDNAKGALKENNAQSP